MTEAFVIKDLDQLKALADPLRQSILSALCCEPATTRQVAEQLGEKPTRLYHHVDLLEKAGLIKLVETRQNRGTIEKYYQAIARQFIVDHQLMRASGEGDAENSPQTHLINMLQESLAEATNLFDAEAVQQAGKGKTMLLAQARMQFSSVQAEAFIQKLQAWLADCGPPEAAEETREYTLKVAFFPVSTTGNDGSE